jgi:hypothetical protein
MSLLTASTEVKRHIASSRMILSRNSNGSMPAPYNLTALQHGSLHLRDKLLGLLLQGWRLELVGGSQLAPTGFTAECHGRLFRLSTPAKIDQRRVYFKRLKMDFGPDRPDAYIWGSQN